jgi:hypothetical protein
MLKKNPYVVAMYFEVFTDELKHLGFALISLGKNGQDISRTNLSKH